MTKQTRKKEKLTVLIEKEIKDKYKEHCESLGLVIGKQIEIFMQSELEKLKEKKPR